jgi:hypothetical protein
VGRKAPLRLQVALLNWQNVWQQLGRQVPTSNLVDYHT